MEEAQDKIIVQEGKSGINMRKVSKKCTRVIIQVENKVQGEFAMKNNNYVV